MTEDTTSPRFLPLVELTEGPMLRDAIDESHVARIAEVMDRIPPLLVDRRGRVLDGHHRLHAARRVGMAAVPVVVAPDDPAAALVEAIRANTQHGLPLTRSERRRAVEALLEVHPDWSDRRIAVVCGVAPTTVGNIRREVGVQTGHLGRVGRDGRDGKRYRLLVQRADRGAQPADSSRRCGVCWPASWPCSEGTTDPAEAKGASAQVGCRVSRTGT